MKTTLRGNRGFFPAAVLLFVAANPCLSFAAGNKDNAAEHWVGTWACAPQAAESADDFASSQFPDGVTLRQIVHTSVGGKTLRIRFSNLAGKETLTIDAAHLATPTAPGEIRPGTDKKLTFGHRDFIAYQQIIFRAHAHGIRVYGATITPFGGSFYATQVSERARQTLNNWIRISGSFDAVLDFDRLTRDPSEPENLLPSFDTGDHLHPGDEGYKAIGRSMDLTLFRRR